MKQKHNNHYLVIDTSGRGYNVTLNALELLKFASHPSEIEDFYDEIDYFCVNAEIGDEYDSDELRIKIIRIK